MSAVAERSPCAPVERVRAFLSLREAAVVTDVPEARMRKDIETGVLTPTRTRAPERLLLRWVDLFALAAVYGSDLLPGALRKKAFEEFETLVDPPCRRHGSDLLDAEEARTASCIWDEPGRLLASCARLSLDGYLFIDVAKAVGDLAPRVAAYADGLRRIERKHGVLGGETVFRNTRLSVRHIGKMYDNDVPIGEILADYPYLSAADVEFARLYHRAHPAVGRPREADLAGHPSAR